jgi:hypothetical protein
MGGCKPSTLYAHAASASYPAANSGDIRGQASLTKAQFSLVAILCHYRRPEHAPESGHALNPLAKSTSSSREGYGLQPVH